jgi:hypothetical protein
VLIEIDFGARTGLPTRLFLRHGDSMWRANGVTERIPTCVSDAAALTAMCVPQRDSGVVATSM